MTPVPGSFDFQGKARAEMIRQGFAPDFPPGALQETAAVQAAAPAPTGSRDLRQLLWSSIDNADSRDLDQIEWASRQPDDSILVRVGIADVDAVVKKNSALDQHARTNATSVYTGGPVFPMLPEKLSTDLTSLAPDADRAAIVIEFVVQPDGQTAQAAVFTAWVRNQAQLDYETVGRWLSQPTPQPFPTGGKPELADQLRLQNEAAARLEKFRREQGALAFNSEENVPIVVNNTVTGFAHLQDNPARQIIESFMIAANAAMARHLRDQKALCLRRIVRTPKHWDRIQALASAAGTTLPALPDAKALGDFLTAQKTRDPLHFPELSLGILKSMGPGEYVVEHPGAEHEGHFGLAVGDYTHATAPNRRFADLLMQRLLKASVNQSAPPYAENELSDLAAHCTERETAARHVERFMKKVAAAILLKPRLGEIFSAIVTGVNKDGAYARLLTAPAEGRVTKGEQGLTVGDKIEVRLAAVDANKGFIDLEKTR